MNMKSKLIHIREALNNMKEDHITESAAECAYYVILSFVPFVILLLTLIQYTPISQEQLIRIVTQIFPNNMNEIVVNVVREVYSKTLGTISISIIFTLFAADKGLFALTKELHLIYKFTDQTNKPWIYLKLMSIVQTIIFIVLVAVSLVIMVFGNSFILAIKEKYGVLKNYTWISQIITQIGFLIISFIVFLLIYKFMSRHKLKLKEQLRGAVFASVALNMVSFIFSKYLEIFKGFSITYGSLTALMLIMMWTYSFFYIIFLGAEINKFYINAENGQNIN